jgi:hypothetical protein
LLPFGAAKGQEKGNARRYEDTTQFGFSSIVSSIELFACRSWFKSRARNRDHLQLWRWRLTKFRSEIR